MNKKSLFIFEVLSTVFIFIVGTILHFTYTWSNNNYFVGMFSAINESTWEHLKLIFFPMLLMILVGNAYLKKEYPNYLCIKTKGLVLGISFIVIFFYTFSGIIGKNIGIINISSFFIAVLLGEFYTYKKLQENKRCSNSLGSIILLVLTLSFITFTFYPPHIGLFQDPTSGTFGIGKQ